MLKLSHHLLISMTVRLCLVAYGEYHDKISAVPYTDVDYRVFTDAADHLLHGKSPYDRHTYRYTPLIALVVVPNLLFHKAWGKILFSMLDLVVAWVLKKLLVKRGVSEQKANLSVAFWLYNPLSIAISTRGNADSLSCLAMLGVVYYLYENSPFYAGILHGLCIHMRLYPIAFSLALYLSLTSERKAVAPSDDADADAVGDADYSLENEKTKRQSVGKPAAWLYAHLRQIFNPNKDQVVLVSSCVSTLALVTVLCYYLYGWKFLHESVFYHLTRRDIRHNFSVYFYMQYLNAEAHVALWQRILFFMPQLLLLLTLTFRFSRKFDLPFCLMAQTFVIVMYNPVVTSQYFVWFLSLMPACIPAIDMTLKQAAAHAALWVAAQLAWLLPAYSLEFRGEQTFLYVWLQGIAFFCANVSILARLIRVYKPQLIIKSDRHCHDD